jgi:hypothetical protein
MQEPIVEARINGLFSTTNQNGQFEFYGDLEKAVAPFKVQLRSFTGKVVTAYLDYLYSQPLFVQF